MKQPKNVPSYRIKKEETSDSDISSDKDNSDSDSSDKVYKYTSLTNTDYKGKSKQANFTKEEIKEKLKGYKALKTSQDKKVLLELQPFKVWIRYFNTETKEFRIGGLLKLVDQELRYIMLVNTNKNITWSVQLKDNIIFIPDPEKQKEKLREKLKEDCEKDKLYKLYKAGKLKKKD